jgi:DNA-binding XRE family transcriptional regulator
VSANSSTLTTVSAFLITAEGNGTPVAPQTKRADVLQWESCFRPQDVPTPEGFEDIDALIESRERNPQKRAALEAARRRLGNKLSASKASLATLRLQKGWSQKRLADAIGTSQPHVARIENGRDNVLLSTANQMAQALGVTLDEINAALGYGSEQK